MVKVYVEGAAPDSAVERTRCRQAFSKFFAGDPRLKGKLPRTIPCGGRKAAFDSFVTAVLNPKPGEFPLLLVDSETAVQKGITVWEHLKSRPGDNWTKPVGAADDQAFLMVQVMESWFLADRDILRSFFGQKFREAAIPEWPQLEAVPKASVYDALERASADCGARKYAKGNLSFALLERISPAKVEASNAFAKAFFERLRNL